MSLDKIHKIIEAMRNERYRFRPVRRTFISKKNGKLRPLGVPSWSDKLVGEVVRLILEAYYDPTFPTIRMGTGRAGAVIPRYARWNGPGPGRCGSSRVISPTVSAVWIMM